MESRLLVLFLTLTMLIGAGCSRDRFAQEVEEARQPPVVEPEVERRDIKPPKIDTEDFEIGGFGGLMSVEILASTRWSACASLTILPRVFSLRPLQGKPIQKRPVLSV